MIRALLALLALFGAVSCNPRETPMPEPRPALWVIEAPDGTDAGWLFGTNHALPAGTRWLTPPLDRAIASAGTLVVEVHDLDPAKIGRIIETTARDEPVPPLANRVSASQMDQLTGILARGGTASRTYDGLETWAAALALGQIGRSGTNGLSVDAELVARFAGRPVEELEGASRQLALFDSMPERDQRALLSAVLAEQADPQSSPEVLARAWLAGDLATIKRAARRGLLADPALYHTLAVERNAAWTLRIAELLAEGRKPLVAVGTAHMLGAEGLPALLSARGYSIRRVQ